MDADGVSTDRVHWIFKNKDQGKTAATASLGLVTLWDVEGGLPQIDKFLYSKDNYVVAGLAHAHTSAACVRLMCGQSSVRPPRVAQHCLVCTVGAGSQGIGLCACRRAHTNGNIYILLHYDGD